MWKSPRATALSSGVCVTAFVLGAAVLASAQGTAVICGTVTDASGGLMPGTTVTLKGPAAQPLPAATTVVGKDGEYLFANIVPGTYSLTFDLEGFKHVVRLGVTLTPNFSARVDQRMELGSPAEYVEFPVPPSVAYDRQKISTGSTFTKTISSGPPVPVRPCKIEKH